MRSVAGVPGRAAQPRGVRDREPAQGRSVMNKPGIGSRAGAICRALRAQVRQLITKAPVIMKHIHTLRHEAVRATAWRGHRMQWSIWTYPGRTPYQHGIGVCQQCGREVSITERPAPNDIEMGGPAVATSCTGSRAQ